MVHSNEFPGDGTFTAYHTRIDWPPIKDKDFRRKLDSEAGQLISEIKSNIENDRRGDTRWSVFLVKKRGTVLDEETQRSAR